jgi:hypothetical protein
MTGGELRAAAAAGDGDAVFVPREEGPAVSWMLTEAALTPPAPVCQ